MLALAPWSVITTGQRSPPVEAPGPRHVRVHRPRRGAVAGKSNRHPGHQAREGLESDQSMTFERASPRRAQVRIGQDDEPPTAPGDPKDGKFIDVVLPPGLVTDLASRTTPVLTAARAFPCAAVRQSRSGIMPRVRSSRVRRVADDGVAMHIAEHVLITSHAQVNHGSVFHDARNELISGTRALFTRQPRSARYTSDENAPGAWLAPVAYRGWHYFRRCPPCRASPSAAQSGIAATWPMPSTVAHAASAVSPHRVSTGDPTGDPIVPSLVGLTSTSNG